MIPAMMWKEWRDQRAISVTILTFGALALALTAMFADSTAGQSLLERAGARELMALAVAYLAGSVCGAMLLADDKELGTIEFLDCLPCTRRRIWFSKAAYGIVFTLLMSIVIAVLAFSFNCLDERLPTWLYLSLIPIASMHGFAWGMFGGAMARSTLGAVFQGGIGSLVVGSVVAIPFAVVIGPSGFGRSFGPALFLYYATWLCSGLFLSALAFTSIDRSRQSIHTSSVETTGGFVRGPRRSPRPRFTSLIWLSARQGAWITLGALAAGLVVGASMLSPEMVPLLVWPPATLLLGVLAGVTTMSEEQTRGVARFWAERRLPLGRLWFTKVTFHFAIAVGAALVMSLPLFANSPASPFRTRLLIHADLGLRANMSAFLWFGLVYGFAVGHLSGMIFRKTIVAGLFAMLVSAILAGFLVPSIIGGGVNRWQLWLPALLLMVTARAILYPWATERMVFRGPILRAASGVALALAVMAAGIAYRVYEIPDSPNRLEESGYVESLPTFEQNVPGRTTRAVAALYRKASEDAQLLLPDREPGSKPNPGRGIDRTILDRAAFGDWTPEAESLKPWLDRVFAEEWPARLLELDQQPQGMFEDPRELNHFSPTTDLRNLREMILVLRLRGLQRQAEGDHATYAKLLRGGLAAIRNARFRGTWRTPDLALECENNLLGGLSDWLELLPNRPDLLRDVLATLVKHEREMSTGVEDAYWAERIVLANTLQQIGTWLPLVLERSGQSNLVGRSQSDHEAELVAVAWNIPWERARRDRLLRLNTDPEREIRFSWLSGLHVKNVWRLDRTGPLRENDRRGLTTRRFLLLQTALHLYQLERGKPAETLDQLVPEYIAEVPKDPFSDDRIHYRLSQGEIIDYNFNFRAGPIPRPDLVLAQLGPASIHFEHFAELLSALARASQTLTPGPPAPAIGASAMVLTEAKPVRRIVRPGVGILWSCGNDGTNDGGHRNGSLGWGRGVGVDWIQLVPAQNPATRKP